MVKKKPIRKVKERVQAEDIDQQKKFFTEIADKNTQEKKAKKYTCYIKIFLKKNHNIKSLNRL